MNRYPRACAGVSIIDNMEIAVEAKASPKILTRHQKGLRSLKEDPPYIQRRMVVCLENKPRITNDNIEILPAKAFARLLWEGGIF